MNKTTFFPVKALVLITICVLCFAAEIDAISCYNCSSVNHDHCPAEMSSQDEDIVPLVSCDSVYEAQYCVKSNGVTGGCEGIQCYRCEETFQASCSDALFNAPLSDCRDVFDANYCVKTIGVFGGSLGITRFCSSRDMGNYCEYIKRPGDQLEYRSCVFTCTSDGCNGSTFVNKSCVGLILFAILVSLRLREQ